MARAAARVAEWSGRGCRRLVGGPGGRGGGQGHAGARERQVEPRRGSAGRGQGGQRLGCKG